MLQQGEGRHRVESNTADESCTEGSERWGDKEVLEKKVQTRETTKMKKPRGGRAALIKTAVELTCPAAGRACPPSPGAVLAGLC